MQAIMETSFDIVYLATVMIIGLKMVKSSNKQYHLFGIMSIVLGLGDSFHLVPRAYALWTTGLEANATALGLGQLITSITMTIFYLILYHIWRDRYKMDTNRQLTIVMYVLAFLRVVLCLMPQNDWFNYHAPITWGIYRNIPFAIMGILIIVIFYTEAKKHNDIHFKYMWLAILLSFAFYAPVVLFAGSYPLVGMLMIPKTLAYVWVVFMGYAQMKHE